MGGGARPRTSRAARSMTSTQLNTSADRKAWWSARRLWYNVTLVVAAPISAALLLTVWGAFETRLPCLEITLFTLLFGGVLFLLGLAPANLCYFLGPLSERVMRPHNAVAFRRSAYAIGLAF